MKRLSPVNEEIICERWFGGVKSHSRMGARIMCTHHSFDKRKLYRIGIGH